jgi:branched-chain amino acid transport system substrate-binding protein
VIERMKATPTDDPLFGKGMVRMDGQVIHDMHLFEVKSPDQSKQAHHAGGKGVPADRPGRLRDRGMRGRPGR